MLDPETPGPSIQGRDQAPVSKQGGLSHMTEHNHAPLPDQGSWVEATQRWVTYGRMSEQALAEFVASVANINVPALAASAASFAAWLASMTNTATLQALSCWAVAATYFPNTPLPAAFVKCLNDLTALQGKLGLTGVPVDLTYDAAVQRAGRLYPIPPPPPLRPALPADDHAPGGIG